MNLMTGGDEGRWCTKMDAAIMQGFKIESEGIESKRGREKVKSPKSYSKSKHKFKNPKTSPSPTSSDQNVYSLRPLINPALILSRYRELVNRAEYSKTERDDEYKQIDIALDRVKEGAKACHEKRTENMVTKVREAVGLTHAGIRLLDNEVNLLGNRVEQAIASLPRSLV